MKHTWHSRCRHELPSWCPLWGSLLFPLASASPWSWPRSPLSEERRLPVGLALQARSFYCFLGSPANSCNLSSCSLPFAYLVTGKWKVSFLLCEIIQGSHPCLFFKMAWGALLLCSRAIPFTACAAVVPLPSRACYPVAERLWFPTCHSSGCCLAFQRT